LKHNSLIDWLLRAQFRARSSFNQKFVYKKFPSRTDLHHRLRVESQCHQSGETPDQLHHASITRSNILDNSELRGHLSTKLNPNGFREFRRHSPNLMRFLAHAWLLFAASPVMSIHWFERHPMPRAQAGGAAAYMGNEVVVAGGTAWDGEVKIWLKDVQIYQPALDRWTNGPPLPVPLAYGPYVASSDGLEILGGSDGAAAQRAAWKLNSAKTKWEQTGSVPEDVLLARAAKIGNSTFLFGGCSDVADLTGCTNAVRRRSGASEWRRISTIPGGPLALSAVAVSVSDVYLFGGCSMGPAGKALNHKNAYRYGSSTNRWESIRELPVANRGLSAVAYGNNFIYLFGGYTDSGFSSEVLSYDIERNSYTRLKPMPAGLLGVEFVLNGNNVYGAGGEDRMRGRSNRLLEGKFVEAH
jgi:N-acetylneuraminic acid mutarotase